MNKARQSALLRILGTVIALVLLVYVLSGRSKPGVLGWRCS
jgi:hypothetical protein